MQGEYLTHFRGSPQLSFQGERGIDLKQFRTGVYKKTFQLQMIIPWSITGRMLLRDMVKYWAAVQMGYLQSSCTGGSGISDSSGGAWISVLNQWPSHTYLGLCSSVFPQLSFCPISPKYNWVDSGEEICKHVAEFYNEFSTFGWEMKSGLVAKKLDLDSRGLCSSPDFATDILCELGWVP